MQFIDEFQNLVPVIILDKVQKDEISQSGRDYQCCEELLLGECCALQNIRECVKEIGDLENVTEMLRRNQTGFWAWLLSMN